MPLFKKVIPSIPKTYNIPPIPSILPKQPPSSSTQSIHKPKIAPLPSANSPICSNCKKQIPKKSPEIKCEGGHVCCNSCFQPAVNVAIRCKTYFIPCAVTGCENNYSEETIKNNIIVSLYEKLLLFKPNQTSFSSISSSSSLLPSPFLSPFDKLSSNGPGIFFFNLFVFIYLNRMQFFQMD
jgi:hypothetical protein